MARGSLGNVAWLIIFNDNSLEYLFVVRSLGIFLIPEPKELIPIYDM